MIGLNIFERFSYNIDQFRIYILIGLSDLFFRDKDIVGIDMGAVKLFRIFKESLISLIFYGIQDFADTFLVFSIAVGTALQKCFQQALFCILVQFFFFFNIPPVL